MSTRYQMLQMFRPTVSSRITQGWGENRACVWPNGKITGTTRVCPVGSQSFYGSVGMRGHNGIDISAWVGEEIYHAATFPGWWRSEVDSRGGIGVDVVSNEPLFFPVPIPTELINTAVPHEQDGKMGFTHHVKIRNWHLSKAVGHEGKQITVGSVIGLAGNTGASSGPHLHVAPKWCLKDGRGVGNSNGYAGAFDPTSYYLHGTTAADHAKYLRQQTVPLSPEELKDMMAQLSSARRLLLSINKLVHKI